jgi:hypothetical protein
MGNIIAIARVSPSLGCSRNDLAECVNYYYCELPKPRSFREIARPSRRFAAERCGSRKDFGISSGDRRVRTASERLLRRSGRLTPALLEQRLRSSEDSAIPLRRFSPPPMQG